VFAAGAFVAGAFVAGAFVAGAFVAGAVVAGAVVVVFVVFVVLTTFVVVLAGAGVPQAEIKTADAAIAVTVNNLTFIYLFFLIIFQSFSKSFEKNISNKFEILALLKKNASKKQQ
jgi:hypothetical protein